jgi:ribonuclease P protein component, eubacterial
MVEKETFRSTMRNGSKAGDRLLTVIYAAPHRGAAFGIPGTEVGFVVSKRQVPLATRRNKIRRRLREVLRTQIPILEAGSKVVVIVKSDAQKASFDELRQSAMGSLSRAIKKGARQQ